MNREQFDILLVVLIAAGLILSNTAGRGRPPVKFFARGAVWALCGVLAYEKALWAAVLLWGLAAVFAGLGARRPEQTSGPDGISLPARKTAAARSSERPGSGGIFMGAELRVSAAPPSAAERCKARSMPREFLLLS
ncbi:MAG: hypothetical protein V8T86_19175 [Victivallis sp.]